ncbi:hypothetical protein CLOM_g15281 [Closterium sp. NIES-68]|nr:hypothetical protein CLOM_g15281 [Closterium sp. NIES-68]
MELQGAAKEEGVGEAEAVGGALAEVEAEDVHGHEGDVGSVGKVVMHPLMHWVIDSGCISHMTPRADLLDEVKPPGKIKYVAAASAATAAAAKATAGGDATAPNDGVLEAVKKVQKQQTHGEVLAGVDASAAWAKASSRSGEADWETWHERLCHVNFPMLQKLVKNGSLKGLEVKGEVKEIGSCPTCLETKFSKFPFNSTTGPAKTPLALVHMDVVGPTRAPSLSGSRYFLTIVDDHTRAVWVYPLKSKGEVAAAVLKEWMPRAQRECGHKVKVIRSDNGGEFIGADFEGELKRKGIQHQLTVPYNPQQNGVAERFNRTLQEGARTLLGHEVQQPSRQVEVAVSEEEMSGVTEEGGAAEVEQQQQQEQQQQHESPPRVPHPPERPRRDVRPPVRLTYGGRGKPNVVQAGSVVEQIEEDEIAHCYWAPIPEPKTREEALNGPNGEKWKASEDEEFGAEQMLEMQFKCSKMGEVKYYLGMHVERDVEKGVLRLHQRKYCEGLAEKYGLQDGGKPATPLPSGFTVEPCADEEVVGDSDRKLFHSMVGSLNYAANHTRPDIAFATSRLASVVSRPSHEQLEAAKRLVRYVSATASVGLEYSGVRQRLQRGAADVKSGEMLLSCYTDASFNSVKADGTSIGGYVCLLGGGAVSWRSKKQNEVGLSSYVVWWMMVGSQRGRLLCDVIICYHILSASHLLFQFVCQS